MATRRRNPRTSSNPRRRRGRRRRRRNPALDFKFWLMATLGGTAAGALCWAVEGFELSKPVTGAIQMVTGAGIGLAGTMVSKGLGGGIAGGGMAVGGKNVAEGLLMMTAKPAETGAAGTTAVRRRNMGAVQVPRQMAAGMDPAGALNNVRAIRARI